MPLASTAADSCDSTTPSLDYSLNASHSRRLSQGYSTPRRVDTSRSAFLADGIPWTEDEKLFYQAVMRMDDLTRYHRAAYVVSQFSAFSICESLVDRYRWRDMGIRKGVSTSTNLGLENRSLSRAKRIARPVRKPPPPRHLKD